MEVISIVISVIALSLSVLTAWITLFRRGSLQLTQPAVVFLGPDGTKENAIMAPPKIFLRTLLHATGKRGVMVETMHVKVTRNETVQNFNIWVYGDRELVRGSGLFVGEEGVSTNHHFLAPKDGSSFSFGEGCYRIELFAKLLSEQRARKVWSDELTISAEQSAEIAAGAGIYFDWGPDSKRYIPHVEKREPLPKPEDFLNKLLLAPTGDQEKKK